MRLNGSYVSTSLHPGCLDYENSKAGSTEWSCLWGFFIYQFRQENVSLYITVGKGDELQFCVVN